MKTPASSKSQGRKKNAVHPVSTVSDFLAAVAKFVPTSSHGKLAVFRGQSDATWDIRPGIARKPLDSSKSICHDPKGKNDNSFEWRVLRLFPDHAHPHLPPWFFLGSEVEVKWRTIVIAQHYRLPTRLIDWTTNPLVALYFAVEGQPHVCGCDGLCDSQNPSGNHHAAVYVLKDRETFGIASLASTSKSPPLYQGRNSPGLIRPPDIDGRIMAQGSLFSITKSPATPLSPDHTILVDVESREPLLRDLDRLGVSCRTIYPGLEGVCHYLRWSSHFWEPNPGYL